MMQEKKEMIKTIAAVTGIVGAAATTAVVVWAKKKYRAIAQEASIDVDGWTQQGDPTAMEAIQTVLMYLFAKKRHQINEKRYRIIAEKSNNVPGLKTTRRAKENESTVDNTEGKPPLIVGSMRKYFIST